MSVAVEDWKRFANLSGQIVVNDPLSDDDGAIANVQTGDWCAVALYSDSNSIERVIAMRDWLITQTLAEGDFAHDGRYRIGRYEIDSSTGIIFIVDRWMRDAIPRHFLVPRCKRSAKIIEMFGDIEDEGKSDSDRFVESCFHLCCDYEHDFPRLESIDYGVVFKLPKGKHMVDVLFDQNRDAVGIMVSAKGASIGMEKEQRRGFRWNS